ncbi:MAG: hypothetical protein HQK75_00965 [Candidatus Magnetomorum sp.]|nr:hypothetical protein [Candidatus Magnetomorum sp.]
MKPYVDHISLKIQHRSLIQLFFFVLLLVVGMACDHTGYYGNYFRGQWDDFYLRALTCIEQKHFQQAVEDFQASLERRPPSKQFDRRMVRSYGMHYLDYFPNREIGFVYYLQHHYEKALIYLNRSILSEPSAKAYYYLEQTKKNLHPFQSPSSQPVLTISEPAEITNKTRELWRSEMPLVIKGTAMDEQWISSITVQDKPVWIDHADPRVNFFTSLFFQEGHHTITIKAKNIKGTTVEKTIFIHVDQSGPALTCKKTETPNTIKIQANDPSGFLELWINQQQITSTENAVLNWEMQWPSNETDMHVCVRDRCNNETCASIAHDQIFSHASLTEWIADNTAMVASDAIPSFGNSHSHDIDIHLNQPDGLTVYLESIDISGQMKSPHPITRILINEKPFPVIASKEIYFSRRMVLSPGDNIISLSADDRSGYMQKKEIHIYRKIPAVFQYEHRYGLSIYPFTVHGEKKQHWIQKYVFFSQPSDTNLYSYQERQFEQNFVKQFIDHHRFRINYQGKSFDHLNPTNINATPCQATLVGDTYTSRFGLEISARIVDNQTSAVLAIKDVYREKNGDMDTHAMAEELSKKIHRAFPLIKGKIVEKIEQGFRIESSPPDILEISWPMLIYREISSSTIEGYDTMILGKANITPYTRTDRFKMIVLDAWNSEQKIQCGDWIIAQ